MTQKGTASTVPIFLLFYFILAAAYGFLLFVKLQAAAVVNLQQTHMKGYLLCCDCGGNVSLSLKQNLNRRPNKKIKDTHYKRLPRFFTLWQPYFICY